LKIREFDNEVGQKAFGRGRAVKRKIGKVYDQDFGIDNVMRLGIQIAYKKLRGQDKNPAPFLKSNIL
jgi:hypothetical protein